MTVNCVRVVLPDQVATNGIIHVIEDVSYSFFRRAVSPCDVAVGASCFILCHSLMLTNGSNSLSINGRRESTSFTFDMFVFCCCVSVNQRLMDIR